MMRSNQKTERALLELTRRDVDCPPLDEVLAIVLEGRTEAGDDLRAQVIDHVESCPHCASEVEVARTLGAGTEEIAEGRGGEGAQAALSSRESERLSSALFDEESAVEAGFGEASYSGGHQVQSAAIKEYAAGSTWWRIAAAALVVGVVGGIAILQLQSSTPPPLPDRTTTPGEVVRGRTLEPVSPVGLLEEIPTRFEWRDTSLDDAEAAANNSETSAADPERRYRITLFGVDSVPLWSAVVNATHYEMKVAERSVLQPGVSYRWRTEALPEGTPFSSLTASFSIDAQAQPTGVQLEGGLR